MAEQMADANVYDWWQRALAGEAIGGPTLPIHEGDAHVGFWRRRASKAGAFLPVAIWRDGESIICVVDGKPADAAEQFSYCCRHPISEEQYHARMETGKWHDEDAAVTNSLAHATSTNNPPTDPLELLTEQIATALKGVDEYSQVNDDAAAAKAQSLRSRLLDLSGDADKKREGLVRPHLDAQKDINGLWQPLVKSAKAGADAIRAAISAHETRQLWAAEKAAAEAAEARRKADLEAAKRAAEAEKAGRPAPTPAPAPPPPEPVPAPSTTVRGAYGRAASKKVIKKARITDYDKAVMALKGHPEMKDLVTKLSQRAIDAGVHVDGVEFDEVVDVR